MPTLHWEGTRLVTDDGYTLAEVTEVYGSALRVELRDHAVEQQSIELTAVLDYQARALIDAWCVAVTGERMPTEGMPVEVR